MPAGTTDGYIGQLDHSKDSAPHAFVNYYCRPHRYRLWTLLLLPTPLARVTASTHLDQCMSAAWETYGPVGHTPLIAADAPTGHELVESIILIYKSLFYFWGGCCGTSLCRCVLLCKNKMG